MLSLVVLKFKGLACGEHSCFKRTFYCVTVQRINKAFIDEEAFNADCFQVLWELLTHEVPFNGIDGFQVAWLVVEKGEVKS